MADQFNLADELRRGGTGLLAQAVASLWKMRFRDQPYAALNEEEYAQAWLYARQQEAETAAVPSGNQAKAPTALDEMRALQEAAKCRNCGGSPGATELCLHCEHLRLRLELEESREALARVEAEREFWRRAAVTEGEYREQNNAIAARWQAECIKRDAVIEAARAYARVKQLGIHAAAEMNALEAALDQAASGPECAQKGHAYATNKGECCIYCFRPKAECLHMGEPASEAEVTTMDGRERLRRFALCHHDIQMHTCPKCRPVPASEAEVTACSCEFANDADRLHHSMGCPAGESR